MDLTEVVFVVMYEQQLSALVSTAWYGDPLTARELERPLLLYIGFPTYNTTHAAS